VFILKFWGSTQTNPGKKMMERYAQVYSNLVFEVKRSASVEFFGCMNAHAKNRLGGVWFKKMVHITL